LKAGGLRTLFSANRNETGERFTSALRNYIETLLQRLPGAKKYT
jgi:hypothetical protein